MDFLLNLCVVSDVENVATDSILVQQKLDELHKIGQEVFISSTPAKCELTASQTWLQVDPNAGRVQVYSEKPNFYLQNLAETHIQPRLQSPTLNTGINLWLLDFIKANQVTQVSVSQEIKYTSNTGSKPWIYLLLPTTGFILLTHQVKCLRKNKLKHLPHTKNLDTVDSSETQVSYDTSEVKMTSVYPQGYTDSYDMEFLESELDNIVNVFNDNPKVNWEKHVVLHKSLTQKVLSAKENSKLPPTVVNSLTSLVDELSLQVNSVVFRVIVLNHRYTTLMQQLVNVDTAETKFKVNILRSTYDTQQYWLENTDAEKLAIEIKSSLKNLKNCLNAKKLDVPHCERLLKECETKQQLLFLYIDRVNKLHLTHESASSTVNDLVKALQEKLNLITYQHHPCYTLAKIELEKASAQVKHKYFISALETYHNALATYNNLEKIIATQE